MCLARAETEEKVTCRRCAKNVFGGAPNTIREGAYAPRIAETTIPETQSPTAIGIFFSQESANTQTRNMPLLTEL